MNRSSALNLHTIKIEELDKSTDTKFIRDFLRPYLQDLYKDLAQRSLTKEAVTEKKIDKVTFLEYCNLPGIIGDRFFKLLDVNGDGLICEKAFITNVCTVFISDLESKMKLTFNM